MPPLCAHSALTLRSLSALSVSVPPVRPPPPMMRPAFVPHILQRPGNFWRLGVFALWVCLNITCSVWNLPYLEQTTCRLDGPCFRTGCWYSTGWSLKLQLKTEFKGICWKHSKTQTSPMGLQSVGQHWNGFINQCRWSLSQLNMDCGLDSVLSGGPRLQMMRGPPVAPPLPRPPPPPPMMLPPSLQGPMPQGPSQPMAAPPQVHKHESVCRLLHVLLRSCKMDERHLEPSRPNLSLSGWWYGFDGVRPTYATSSPTSCQTNTVNHPGSTNCVRCSSCPCWTKKKWSSRSETGPNGILIRAWRTHLFYAGFFQMYRTCSFWGLVIWVLQEELAARVAEQQAAVMAAGLLSKKESEDSGTVIGPSMPEPEPPQTEVDFCKTLCSLLCNEEREPVNI